jgi:DNA adenine methylase
VPRQSHPKSKAPGGHWSPLRYPGGKKRLLSYTEAWLKAHPDVDHLVEGFAGGACVGVTALCEGLVDRLTLVERDPDLAFFWQVVFSDDGEELARRILSIPDLAAANRRYDQLGESPADPVDQALRLFLDIRVRFNGNRKSGGRVGTRPGAKLRDARYTPERLAARVAELAARQDAVTVLHGDALEVLPGLARADDVAFYLDPPYTVGRNGPARELYPHWRINNKKLFEVVRDLRRPFLLSHYDHPSIERLARDSHLALARLTAPNSRSQSFTELLISHELWWLERAEPAAAAPDAEIPTHGPLSAAGVDLDLLPSFLVLAEELHYARAAARLGINRPALTQQRQRLEQQLGLRLFAGHTRRTERQRAKRSATESRLRLPSLRSASLRRCGELGNECVFVHLVQQSRPACSAVDGTVGPMESVVAARVARLVGLGSAGPQSSDVTRCRKHSPHTDISPSPLGVHSPQISQGAIQSSRHSEPHPKQTHRVPGATSPVGPR